MYIESIYVLFDSRARSATGKRTVYEFPETHQGLLQAWSLVLRDEVPDEYDDYITLAQDTSDAPQVFNDFWASYGWSLELYGPNNNFPDDVDVKDPPNA